MVGDRPGDSKVGDFGGPAHVGLVERWCEQHVGWLNIQMQDSLLVDVVNSAGNLPYQLGDFTQIGQMP